MNRRRLTLALLAVTALALPVSAQETVPDPIAEFIAAVDDPANADFISQFTRRPTDGVGSVPDPTGDIGTSQGEPPGYSPPHVDLIMVNGGELLPGAPGFGPTVGGPWDQGANQLNGAWTFTSDTTTFDGSQYADGAWLFHLQTDGPIPASPTGRCEFVFWLSDPSIPTVWENQPAFPFDPAGGTNRAFGIGFNPDGTAGAFGLTLTDGFFSFDESTDVRGFVDGPNAIVTVPKSEVPTFDAWNGYAFCVDEGFSFAPEDVGSDQTGLISLDPGIDFGLVEVGPPPTTTTTGATTTTTAPSTTTTVQDTTTTTSVAEPTAGDDGFPWGLVLGGGLLLALIGSWLFNRPDGDPCADELAAWKAAQAKCEAATKAADDAKQECDEKKARREGYEDEEKQICRAWPPACWDSEDGSWVEDSDGNRITSRDLHMKEMALGDVWDQYQAGDLTAQEVEAKWREADTPEFREEMREKDAEATKDLAEVRDLLEKAKEAEKAACDAAEKAQVAADEACSAADAARRRYEECIGRAVAPPATGGGSEGRPDGPTGPGSTPGGGGGTPEADPCEGVEGRQVRRAGRSDSLLVVVDFSMIVSVSEGSERNVEAGEQIAVNLQELARELDLVGDLLAAREAGSSLGGGVNSLRTGKWVEGAGGVVQGGTGAYLAGQSKIPDIPTSLPTAVVEGLEGIAKLGAIIAGKVTEWMTNYQILEARITYFTQRVTATPYTVWECRPGEGWVCVERIWEFEVGRLGRLPGPRSGVYTMNSDVRRHAARRRFRTMSQAAGRKVVADAKRLADWRADHRPGPCQ